MTIVTGIRGLVLAVLCGPVAAVAAAPRLVERLTEAAPGADPAVLRLAAQAVACAEPHPSGRLAVIDYSRPSSEPRLWVFDLDRSALLHEELVAHGRNTGELHAQRFSNVPGSFASSLGLFRTLDPYYGRNGYSLRMQGLEPGYNDRAYERAIVIHGADYVASSFIDRTGRLGRSLGCPAVRTEVARELIDSLSGGQYLFAYYPDPDWLADSRFVTCRSRSSAELSAAP